MGHTPLVPAWSDPGLHQHAEAEELYILWHGELLLGVAGFLLTLRPREILVVKPEVPHLVLGGTGPIEFFGMRAPNGDDKQVLGPVPAYWPLSADEGERELRREWGYRIPLLEAQNRNCWLTGLGAARFYSPNLLLAYLDFPTTAEAHAGLGTRHRLHLHRESWEYYVVLEGSKELQVEDQVVTVRAGEALQVPPGVRHVLHSRQAPFRGFTFRAPNRDDKVES